MNQAANGFDRIPTRLVGDHLKYVKVSWVRGGRPADPKERLVALLTTVLAGSILWEDERIADLETSLVADVGIPELLEGYAPYTSMLMIDEGGALLTLTGSSWGLRNAVTGLIEQFKMIKQKAFPVVTLGSRPSGNKYAMINPTLDVVAWSPREDFDAILGPQGETKAIAAPQARRPPADIIDDDLPF